MRRCSILGVVFSVSVLWLLLTIGLLEELLKRNRINKFIEEYERNYHEGHFKHFKQRLTGKKLPMLNRFTVHHNNENLLYNVNPFTKKSKPPRSIVLNVKDYPILELSDSEENGTINDKQEQLLQKFLNLEDVENKNETSVDGNKQQKEEDHQRKEFQHNDGHLETHKVKKNQPSFNNAVRLMQKMAGEDKIVKRHLNRPVTGGRRLNLRDSEINKHTTRKGNDSVKKLPGAPSVYDGAVANINLKQNLAQTLPLVVDLDKIVSRAPANAPGEYGKPVWLNMGDLSPGETQKHNQMFQAHQFDEYVSEMISLRRRIPDERNNQCKQMKFDKQLPDTSVIICFHNEAWSVLLRTIYSVLDRSPQYLVKEIILVDDFSTKEYLKGKLEKEMTKLQKIKIIRTKKREGIVRSRLLGHSIATGQVLTFLDSHCECYPGWLEPLLQRVKDNPKIVIAPVINVINMKTFAANQFRLADIGTFKIRSMDFNWRPLSPRDEEGRTKVTDPYKTATMAGGLFSMSKSYFEELGTYDTGMDVWGGENLEMSFRVWMCGGSIEIHPCSHVGHIFRKTSPYSWGRPMPSILRKNAVRVAEVWMDKYRHFYYEYLQYRLGDYGDVSERKLLRKKLKCKSFEWYLKNIAPEIQIPENILYAGELRNDNSSLCLDTFNNGSSDGQLRVFPCHGQGGNQFFVMGVTGTIRRSLYCIGLKPGSSSIVFASCTIPNLIHSWLYTKDKHLLLKEKNMCLTLTVGKSSVYLDACSNSILQQWSWGSTP